MRVRRLWWLVLLFAGCVIIVDPNADNNSGGNKPPGDPGDLPDIGWPGGDPLGDGGHGGGGNGDGGGGGGSVGDNDGGTPISRDGGLTFPPPSKGDGGTTPPPPPKNFPGSGGSMGTTGILWLVRIDRGTANLANAYADLMDRTQRALTASGFAVDPIAIAPLYGGENISSLLWGTSNQAPTTVPVVDTLRYYASQSGSFTTLSCTTNNLFQKTAWLDGRAVAYPNTLAGGGYTTKPFKQPPAVLLIGFIDTSARPNEVDAYSCQRGGLSPSAILGQADTRSWLYFSNGSRPQQQVRLLFFGTAEGVSPAEMQTHCRAQPGFDQNGLDQMAPSPYAFFDTLEQRVPQMSERLDLCDALSDRWSALAPAFAQSWRQTLQSIQP